MATMLKDDRKWKAIEFDNFSEFLDYAEEGPSMAHKRRCGITGSGGKSWETNNVDFHGNEDFAEAVREAREGWREGVDRMSVLRSRLDRLTQAASSLKAQSIQFDVTGEWLDIGKFVQGSPECWGGYVAGGEDAAAKVVRVKINISCSGALSQGPIFARGAVCLAVVDLLETLGHRVELTLGSCADNKVEGRFEWQVVAKRAGEPLDIDRLTYFLCHRSGLRRFGFSCYERLGRTSFGTPTAFLGHDEPGCVYVPHMINESDYTGEELERQVIAMCEAAGVSFSEEALGELLGARR